MDDLYFFKESYKAVNGSQDPKLLGMDALVKDKLTAAVAGVWENTFNEIAIDPHAPESETDLSKRKRFRRDLKQRAAVRYKQQNKVGFVWWMFIGQIMLSIVIQILIKRWLERNKFQMNRS